MERNAKPNFPSAPKLSLSTKFTGGQFRWGYFRPDDVKKLNSLILLSLVSEGKCISEPQ
jgi:hypothetical protein